MIDLDEKLTNGKVEQWHGVTNFLVVSYFIFSYSLLSFSIV